MNQPTRLKPLFRPGRLLVASDALTALRASGIPVISVLLRHVAGDWGTVSDEDRQQNDLSISAGLRLISLYPPAGPDPHPGYYPVGSIEHDHRTI